MDYNDLDLAIGMFIPNYHRQNEIIKNWFSQPNQRSRFLDMKRRYEELDAFGWYLPPLPTKHIPDYQAYLETPYWKIVRAEIEIKAGHACQLCNSKEKPFHIHHSTYSILFRELTEINRERMVCLCESCHKKFHGIQEAGR